MGGDTLLERTAFELAAFSPNLDLPSTQSASSMHSDMDDEEEALLPQTDSSAERDSSATWSEPAAAVGPSPGDGRGKATFADDEELMAAEAGLLDARDSVDHTGVLQAATLECRRC